MRRWKPNRDLEAVAELVPAGQHAWTFEAHVPPGAYRRFTVEASRDSDGVPVTIPVGQILVDGNVEVELTATDFHVPQVDGQLWFDGRPSPPVDVAHGLDQWAQSRFDCLEGCIHGRTEYLADAEPGAYSLPLHPGRYRVSLTVNARVRNVDLPQGGVEYVLDSNFEVRGEGRRDFDVQLHRVEVRLDTAPGALEDLVDMPDRTLIQFAQVRPGLDPLFHGRAAQSRLYRSGAMTRTATATLFSGHYRAYPDLRLRTARIHSLYGPFAAFEAGGHVTVDALVPIRWMDVQLVEHWGPLVTQPMPDRLALGAPNYGASIRLDGEFHTQFHYIDFGPRVQAWAERDVGWLLLDPCNER